MRKMNFKNEKALTLVALIVTIIVLIILAGISVNLLLGDNGIIDKAKASSFMVRYKDVEEKVKLYKFSKDIEEQSNKTSLSNAQKLPVSTKLSSSDIDGLDETLKKEIEQVSKSENITELNIYNIDKQKAGIEYDYIIDVDSQQLYDVKGERYYGRMHHTLIGEGQVETPKKKEYAEDEATIVTEGDIGWYSPNINGFNLDNTYMIYYNPLNLDDTQSIKLRKYIEDGKQSKIKVNNVDYVLEDYKNEIWANIKTTAYGKEAWWVWVPRYAYKLDGNNVDVIFVDLDNKPIGTKYGSALPDGYDVHVAFIPSGSDGSKNLQGIWMAKYEASVEEQERDSMVLKPNMEGFDENYTYIELYDSATDTFYDEKLLKDVDLNTVNNQNKWYDYENNIWANIKTTANGKEAWWVWVPRYAYYLEPATKEVEIIFVDLNDKPLNKEKYGDKLPSNFKVHTAFTPSGSDGSKNLQGIWMAKYEASDS